MRSEPARIPPVTCSSETQWGIHSAIRDNVCTRCGWVAREERPARIVPLSVPEQLRSAA